MGELVEAADWSGEKDYIAVVLLGFCRRAGARGVGTLDSHRTASICWMEWVVGLGYWA